MTTSNAAILALSKGPLRDHLEDWLTKYSKRKDEEPGRYSAVYQLIEDFATFAKEYRTFLLDLAKAPIVPKNKGTYYEYQITRRLVHEWIEIGHVLEQREHVRYAGWLKERDNVTSTLLPASFGPETNVVAYMGSSTELRHLSYSKVSIVSVPYDTYKDDDEALMSLAHELGHHVWRLILYSRDSSSKGSVANRITVNASRVAQETARPPAAPGQDFAVGALVYSWMQELFADVYGAYALFQSKGDAGTREFVESYVNLLQGQIEKKNELLVNDGAHPFPYLRPIIRAHVLKSLTKSNSILERDEIGWKRFLQDLELPVESEDVKFTIPSGLVPPESGAAFDTNQAKDPNHKHNWEPHTVQLSVVERAVTTVIDNVVLPEVQKLWNGTKFPYQPAFTFERWIESVLPSGATPTLEELLSATISLQQGMNSAGDSSSGLVCGSHDHTGVDANHTHTCK